VWAGRLRYRIAQAGGAARRSTVAPFCYPEDMKLADIVWADPGRLGGTPCFASTRVPVQTLLDYLEDGDSIDDFLGVYPSVSREQVVTFLELAKDRLLECAFS